MSSLQKQLKLYFVMGSVNCGPADPVRVLEAALRGGVTFFQYREKGIGALQGEEKLALGLRLKQLCTEYQVPFIVNDHIELALALEADGIHIGQEDGSISDIRTRLGRGKFLGVSAHDLEEAEEAVKQGADYLGVGPMYPTSTKLDIAEVRGPSVIRDIRGKLPSVPIVGIGGISAENAVPVLQAGADGVAVISAVSLAADPYLEAKKLRSFITT